MNLLQKQSQQRPDCPFSDAYSNGMPKRYLKPNKLSNMVNFRDSLRKVIKVTKLIDENSTNHILDDICGDNDIQNSFDNYIKYLVKQHVNNNNLDNSFNLEKFTEMNRYLFESNV